MTKLAIPTLMCDTPLQGHFREGEALMGMKRYDEALSSFEEALRLIDVGEDPESASKVTERLEAAKDAVELVRKVAEAQQELESVNKVASPACCTRGFRET